MSERAFEERMLPKMNQECKSDNINDRQRALNSLTEIGSFYRISKSINFQFRTYQKSTRRRKYRKPFKWAYTTQLANCSTLKMTCVEICRRRFSQSCARITLAVELASDSFPISPTYSKVSNLSYRWKVRVNCLISKSLAYRLCEKAVLH